MAIYEIDSRNKMIILDGPTDAGEIYNEVSDWLDQAENIFENGFLEVEFLVFTVRSYNGWTILGEVTPHTVA